MIHELKTWPGPFQDMTLGLKEFEVRKNDRNYQPGEILLLKEWHPHTGYTGREIEAHIKYILTGGQFGIQEGYVVLGLCSIEAVSP